MLIAELCRSIGIPVVTRNLMVDYCDNHGNYFHKPMQTIAPPGFQEKDTDLINRIRGEFGQQGYDVCGIQEAIGEFELEELEDIFNGGRLGEVSVVLLYLDAELAAEMANKGMG